jgi:hypothetical protein
VATIAEVSANLGKWSAFVSGLLSCNEDVLCEPIAGKWSIRDIVSHIMGWDQNFLNTLEQIINNEDVLLEEHHDVQAFNEASVAFGRKMNPHDLLREAISRREQLICKLNRISEAAFTRQFPNSPYTLESFLQTMFVDHDRHHEEQIRKFLS